MLKNFESLLSANNFDVHLIPASGAAPVDQLVIALAPDEQGRERSLWLTLLPDLEQDLEEGLRMLQFLVKLPFQSNPNTEHQLASRILQLNNTMPIGGFGLKQPENLILFRYVLMIGPDRDINGRIVIETVTLISFLLDQFSKLIEDAVSG